MPNPHKGEVSCTAGDASYTLRLTVNAICELEAMSGKRFEELAGLVTEGSITTARLLMWGALRHHHPEMTEEGAGELMSLIGIGQTSVILSEAITAAFPDPPKPPVNRRRQAHK